MSSSEPPVVGPAARPAYNQADLRYLRGALLAVEQVVRASKIAAAGAADPRVRALARREGAAHAIRIHAITSLLLGWGRFEAGSDTASPALVTDTVDSGGDPRPLDGLEIDRRFIETLTAHAVASLASARTELIEGFGGASRRLAEDTSRCSWRDLAALALLAPVHDRVPAQSALLGPR